MKTIQIEKTEDSPSVHFNFDTNTYKMGGDSRPENPGTFYKPIIDWIRDLKAHVYFESDLNKDKKEYHKEMVFEFHFEYLNSISIKFIFDVLREIDRLNDPKPVAKINWYYGKDDELMLENGQDYAYLIKTKIHLIEK